MHIKSQWLARFLCPTPESLSTLRELFISAIKTVEIFTNGRPICLAIYNGCILAANPVYSRYTGLAPKIQPLYIVSQIGRSFVKFCVVLIAEMNSSRSVDNDSGVGNKKRASHCDFICIYMKNFRSEP